MVFLDFRKAFDSVKHSKIGEALERQEVSGKIVRILVKIYGRAKAYVKMGRKGTTFRVMNGIKQGDPMSSSIFNSGWRRSSGN